MKRLTLLCILLPMSAFPGRAGLTLVQRETFQGVGTLNAASPDNLGTVTGSFYKRPVGPRVSGDATVAGRGWSADVQGQTDAFARLPFGSGVLPNAASGDPTIYALDLWYFLKAPLNGFAGGNGQELIFLGDNAGNGAPILTLRTDYGDGQTLTAASNNGAYTGAGFKLPLLGWTQLRVAWSQVPGYYTYRCSVLARSPGSAAFTEIFSTTYQLYGAADILRFGFHNVSGVAAANARVGLESTYQLGTWEDRTLSDATVLDPAAGPFAWYVDPATGSDGSDGTTPQTAWASVAKVNAESQFCGLIPRTTGYATGDTLTIDTTAANLPLGAASLFLRTQGLNVVQAGNGEIQAWENVSGPGWTLTSGTSHVYQRPLSGPGTGNADVVLWQNDRWLNHPTGNALADVQATLEATEGSFFVEAGVAYLQH